MKFLTNYIDNTCMEHSKMNALSTDLIHRVLNDPSLQSKQDVQNISAVCTAFKENKDVPKWRMPTNVPRSIFMSAENRSCSELHLSGCNLDGIIVPASLPVSLKKLELYQAKNIPADLITKAKALPHCNVKT